MKWVYTLGECLLCNTNARTLIEGWWGWGVSWKQCFTSLWDQGSTNLNLVVLCMGIPEAVQSSKGSSPVVAGQIVLDLVKI